MAATVSGQWGYSVPLEDTNGNARATASRTNSHEIRSLSRQNSSWDLQSDSEATKTRKVTNRAAHAGASRKRSRNALRDTKRDKPEKNEPSVDDSAWIHRDKLAQIEIREMEEAGFPVRHSQRSMSVGQTSEFDPRTRSMSRSEARPPTAQDMSSDEVYDDEPTNGHGGYRDTERKRVSTIPAADEEEAYEQRVESDYRAHNEPVTELPTSNGHHHVSRPSTSRIPISAKSPPLAASDTVGRDPSMPRSRAGSNAPINNWDDLNRRGRSNSMSSQVLPDDSQPDEPRTTPPPAGSKQSTQPSPKARTPQKTNPAAKKTSGLPTRPGSSQGKKVRRPSASASAVKRPGSSQGHKTSPSVGYTWDPQEADAPWITNMYKPDPRLPPDQQILPTHMKRMMQEQWEKEGKTGTAYDRQFGLLNDEDVLKPPSPAKTPDDNPLDFDLPHELRDLPKPPEPIDNLSPTSPTAHPTSPTSPHDVKSETGSVRAGATGGYRITPSITQTPNMYRSPLASPQLPSPHYAPPSVVTEPTPPRIQHVDEKQDTESAAGCCCVVM